MVPPGATILANRVCTTYRSVPAYRHSRANLNNRFNKGTTSAGDHSVVHPSPWSVEAKGGATRREPRQVNLELLTGASRGDA